MILAPDFELAPSLKLQIPFGGGMDLVSGTWFEGMFGEYIANAGHPFVIGMVGLGNNFKSTILDDLATEAMSRIFESCFKPEKKEKHLKRMKTTNSKYDTEVNVQESRLAMIAEACRYFKEKGIDLFNAEEIYWRVTDKTVMWGNKFFEKLKDFLAFKRKNRKDYLVETPFLDRDGKSRIQVILPTFGSVDSLTDFQSEAEEKIMVAELGHSDANMLFARGGLIKTRLLGELPPMCAGGYHYMGITAQLNKDMAMATGPGGASVPRKALQYLKGGDKIVGATNKFTYATSLGLNAYNARPLTDKDRMPEYIRRGHNVEAGDTDLNIVDLIVLRNKNGPTGDIKQLIVTQTGGIEYELSQFHYIRNFPAPPDDKSKRPGIIGKGAYYTLALYPGKAITRNSLRDTIDEDRKLRTALWYTQELLEISCEERFVDAVWSKWGCDLEVLHADLTKMGYDMDWILENCRPYWLFNNEHNPRPFLSSVDLLRMRAGLYHPFWMTEDKKGIKPEYQFTAD